MRSNAQRHCLSRRPRAINVLAMRFLSLLTQGSNEFLDYAKYIIGKDNFIYKLIMVKRVKRSFPNEISLRIYVIDSWSPPAVHGERSFSKLKYII